MKKTLSPVQRSLNLWAIILIVWSIYRYNFKLPEWFDELIAKPLVFVLPVFYYIQKLEKKDFLKEIWLKTENLSEELLFGVGIGLLFLISANLGVFFKYHRFILFSNNKSLETIGGLFFISLATGITEEILSRGFVLKRLYEDSKNILSASFFASLLFFFLHVPILFTNYKIVGNILLFIMFTDISLSLALSFIFLTRKSLIVPILIHAFYNFFILIFI